MAWDPKPQLGSFGQLFALPGGRTSVVSTVSTQEALGQMALMVSPEGIKHLLKNKKNTSRA